MFYICNINRLVNFYIAMKRELVDALTAKFEGVSASIIDRIATKLSKTVKTAEDVKTAVDGVTIQQVIESYADSRATEAANTARENAVKDYETRHGLKDGKPNDGGKPNDKATEQKPNGGQDDKVPAWAQALIGAVAELKASKTTNDRKQQLNDVIGNVSEPLRKAYERLPLDKLTDEEFSKTLSEIKTEVEGFADDEQARGGVFGRPTASQGKQTKELTKGQLDAIAHREGVTADGEQPF